jgi:hypothetical protein
MKKLDSYTVLLDQDEMDAMRDYEILLGRGHSEDEARNKVKEDYPALKVSFWRFVGTAPNRDQLNRRQATV